LQFGDHEVRPMCANKSLQIENRKMFGQTFRERNAVVYVED